MAEITLKATTGRALGSGPSKQLRAAGKIPAVVYGLDADPIPVTVEWKPLREALTTEAGLNALIDLDIDGAVAMCVVKELQRHAIRGDVLHVDFLRVSADAEISIEVPIVVEGEAKAVAMDGGTVDHLLFHLTVSAKPADIPNEIVVDVTDLQVGDAIRVGDLNLPAGVTTHVDAEEAVVMAQAGAVGGGEEAEGEAGAEPGDGGEAAADDAGADAEG